MNNFRFSFKAIFRRLFRVIVANFLWLVFVLSQINNNRPIVKICDNSLIEMGMTGKSVLKHLLTGIFCMLLTSSRLTRFNYFPLRARVGGLNATPKEPWPASEGSLPISYHWQKSARAARIMMCWLTWFEMLSGAFVEIKLSTYLALLSVQHESENLHVVSW